MVTKQTPIEVLERTITESHAAACADIPIERCSDCTEARMALGQVETLAAAAWRDHRDATGHLQPGEFGVVNPDTYASMGCKSCAALGPFQVKP